MIIYLAMIAPEDQSPTVLGAFSTLDLARAAFADQENEWVFNDRHGQWWQKDASPHGFGDNEIHPLTIDERIGR